jgi:HEAT repeat protein
MKGLSPDQLVAKYRDIQDESSKKTLAGIDSIDWQSLTHAHGAASDVPALLHAALSQEEYDREFAFALLFETVIHQGSVYEATVYTVPFLFQMLQSPSTPDRSTVAFLLACFADGTPGTNMDPKYQWVNAAQEAVGKRLELLYPFLANPEPDVRAAIAIALSFYPDFSQETIPLLKKALKSEDDKLTLAEIEKSIGKLTGASSL